MQVNDEYFEKLDESKLDALLEDLKHGKYPLKG